MKNSLSLWRSSLQCSAAWSPSPPSFANAAYAVKPPTEDAPTSFEACARITPFFPSLSCKFCFSDIKR
jgi:hypothetical protein